MRCRAREGKFFLVDEGKEALATSIATPWGSSRRRQHAVSCCVVASAIHADILTLRVGGTSFSQASLRDRIAFDVGSAIGVCRARIGQAAMARRAMLKGGAIGVGHAAGHALFRVCASAGRRLADRRRVHGGACSVVDARVLWHITDAAERSSVGGEADACIVHVAVRRRSAFAGHEDDAAACAAAAARAHGSACATIAAA